MMAVKLLREGRFWDMRGHLQMKLRSIRDFIPFLNHLARWNLIYRLRQSWDETLSVDFVCGETLIEVEFFDDHIEYSFFVRDRSEVHDFPWLIEQIQWNTELIVPADRRMKLRGIRDLVPFLNMLKEKRQPFSLEKTHDAAITVALAMPGKRIHVDIFEARVEYRYFSGDEAVEDDQDWLFSKISEAAAARSA